MAYNFPRMIPNYAIIKYVYRQTIPTFLCLIFVSDLCLIYWMDELRNCSWSEIELLAKHKIIINYLNKKYEVIVKSRR